MIQTQRATRYSGISQHNSYGIYKYLANKGIYEHSDQISIIEDYLTYKQFETRHKKKSDINNAKAQFIQNKFQEFAKYVTNHLKQQPKL